MVAASLAGVVLSAVLVWLVVDYASQRPDEVNLGDRVFSVGDARRLAARIERDGAPFLFKDPLTSAPGREVYVQHLGPEADEGWIAIEAYAPGAARRIRCVLRWDPRRERFDDLCGGRSFAADGTGLRTYPAEVDERGVVVVDLRSRDEATSTTAA